MNIGELKDELEMWPDETEVRLAIQPHYPFEHEVEQAVGVSRHAFVQSTDKDADEYQCGKCEEPEDEHPAEAETVFYIAEGYQLGYLSGDVSDALQGWR